MTLFGRKKREGEKEVEGKTTPVSAKIPGTTDENLSDILRNPRITEKATAHSERGVYAFDVSGSATKRNVSQAILALYKVRPRIVRIVPILSKVRRSMKTGKRGVSRGGKKAYVYLKKGETITVA